MQAHSHRPLCLGAGLRGQGLLPRRAPAAWRRLAAARPVCASNAEAAAAQQQVPARFAPDDWRRKAKPIQPGSSYPAKVCRALCYERLGPGCQ